MGVNSSQLLKELPCRLSDNKSSTLYFLFNKKNVEYFVPPNSLYTTKHITHSEDTLYFLKTTGLCISWEKECSNNKKNNSI